MAKYINTTLIAVIALLVAAAPADASNPCIRMRAAANVDDAVIRLSDIADILAKDAGLQLRLESLVISQLDAEQTKTCLKPAQINSALNDAGIVPATVDLYGAGKCLITVSVSAPEPATPAPIILPELPEVPGYTLYDQLTETVAQLLGHDQHQFTADWYCRKNPQLLKESAENNRFQILPQSHGNLLGRVYLDVVDTAAVSSEAKSRQTIGVHGNVSYLCEFLVAADALRSGDIITPGDLKLIARRVDNPRDIGVTDEQLLIGRKLTRPVAANQLVSTSMLRKVEVIKRNDLVEVRTSVRGVSITTQGIARSAAGLGDSILVACGHSRDSIRGRVTGPGRVVVGSDPAPLLLTAQAQDYRPPLVMEN